jgi:hypothetical protein
MPAGSEVAILSRIIQPDKPALSPDLAQLFLQWEFPADDQKQMHELLEKAKAGTLSAEEKAQAENYERVGHFLSLLKAKARASLQARAS